MSELDNARHELFAALVAFGKATPAEAYLKAGYKAKDERVASAAATRLLKHVNVKARIAELQAGRVERLNIETTDVVRWLHAVAAFDIRKVVEWKTVKGQLKVTLVPSAKIDETTAMAIKGIKVLPTGGFEVIFKESAAARLLGMHLGMFQGESAGSVNAGTTIIDNSKNVTYIDAPRRESVEEWQARIERERGPKQIEAKVV